MWLTWRVLADDGRWPMPHLAELRNVYWDQNSIRLVNGQPMQSDTEDWLPSSVLMNTPVAPAIHRIDFPSGDTVIARPATANDRPAPEANLRLAVILDRSRSMAKRADEVRAELARLRELADAGADIDIYLTASAIRGEPPSVADLTTLDPATILYYGGRHAAELLAQFNALDKNQEYDAVLTLTDNSGYELGKAEVEITVPDAPVWMVHLGDALPLGYDDDTLAAIQASGGGGAGDIDEALARLALSRRVTQRNTQATSDVIDGYVWQTFPKDAVDASPGTDVITHKPSDGFAAFAARRLILSAMQRERAQLAQLDTLDQLHTLAIEHSIVTPYSSMIVLINDAQRARLEQLQQQDDRFEREFEAVGETQAENPVVTGVPEPEEWLLIGMALAFALWFGYTSRARKLRTES
jgi:putative PEP-CTERM system integral membrane protein